MRYLEFLLCSALTVLSVNAFAGSSASNQNDFVAAMAESQKMMFDAALKSMSSAKPETIMQVADMYRVGIGTKKNLKESFKYYNEASKKNYAPAQERIAQFYLSGEGIKEDTAKGIEWLDRAAKNGSYEAMIQLSVRYKNGLGLKQSDEGYKYWQDKADKQMAIELKKTNSSQSQPSSMIVNPKTSNSINNSPRITPRNNRDYGLDRL